MSLPTNVSTRIVGGGLKYIETDRYGKATGTWQEIPAAMRDAGVGDIQGSYQWSAAEGRYVKFEFPGSAYDPIFDTEGNRVG